MVKRNPTNQDIAAVLDHIADLLEVQDANPFRIRSYREGANTIRQANRPVAELVSADRLDELKKMPNIGSGLVAVIADYVHSGQSGLLQQLQTEVDPVEAFAQLPGMDQELAQRVVDQLEVSTFQELEQAVYNGTLEQVEGFDPQKIKALRTSLAGMLSGAAQSRVARKQAEAEGRPPPEHPSVALLLEIDAEYRQKAAAGQLKTIAPKRFNPENEAWLPVMSVNRAGWNFTALYSNTAQAHRLGKTQDWVVIYYARSARSGYESQATVVTGSGDLAGRRVVRGREMETMQLYEKHKEKGS